MDYGAMPPEFNSARMYAGAGSAPMLTAAAAWNSLAAELSSAARSYQTVISELIDYGWLGPASTAMAAAAAPYAEWMTTTAAQAEQTAAQATDAAGAYEAAYAATVPPAQVAANRTQLASLVATNIVGQNASAIAAVEAQYGQMWAQDAAAMYGYAANSAAASSVTPFQTPAQNTNSAGLAAQSGVAGSSAGTGAQNSLSQLVSSVPNALQNLASPATSGDIFGPGTNTATTGLAGFLNAIDGANNSAGGTFLNSSLTNGLVSGGYVSPAFITPAVTSGIADLYVVSRGAGGMIGGLPVPGGLGGGLGGGVGIPALSSLASAGTPTSAGLPGFGGSPVSADVGGATLVGKLAVPQSWTPANQMTTPINSGAMEFHTVGMAAAQDAGSGMAGMPGMPGMPIMGGGGRSFSFAVPRYGVRPTVMAQPPAAG